MGLGGDIGGYVGIQDADELVAVRGEENEGHEEVACQLEGEIHRVHHLEKANGKR